MANKVPSKKRKCNFSDQLKKDYPHMKAVDGSESSVSCSICQSVFSIASGGRTSIKEHVRSVKHRQAISARASNRVTDFFRRTEPTQSEYDLCVQEGTFAFHTVVHNHSFRSMDCTSGLNRKFYCPKFSCARTKCEAIVTQVFAPWAAEELIADLNEADFVSVLADASNHGHIKLFPIMGRYLKVSQVDGESTMQTKLLDFVELTGETAEQLTAEVMKVIEKYSIQDKVVAFSADNTNTNFGGMKRRGKENVITKLQNYLGKSVFGLGCQAHIVHNCAHTAIGMIPLDVENLVVKVFGYFHIYTVRVERLKEFCDFVGQEFQNILGYCNVRWLSLLPAVERILLMYEPLKSFFLSEDKCPAVLRRMFQDPCTELWLAFVHANMSLFHNTIKMLEGDSRCVVESTLVVDDLRKKLTSRGEDSFVASLVKPLLKRLEEEGLVQRRDFVEVSTSFFETASSYLESWGANTSNFSDLKCMLLKTIPSRDEVERAVEVIREQCSNVTIDEDELFDEVTSLREFLTPRIDEWNNPASDITVCGRWNAVLLHFRACQVPYANLLKLAGLILCLPGSNASVERVFSLMNDMWSSGKSQLKVETAKAMLTVRTHFSMSCAEFSDKLKNNNAKLKKIHSSEKYTA